MSSTNRERLGLAAAGLIGAAVGVTATLIWHWHNERIRRRSEQHMSVGELVGELKREISYLNHQLTPTGGLSPARTRRQSGSANGTELNVAKLPAYPSTTNKMSSMMCIRFAKKKPITTVSTQSSDTNSQFDHGDVYVNIREKKSVKIFIESPTKRSSQSKLKRQLSIFNFKRSKSAPLITAPDEKDTRLVIGQPGTPPPPYQEKDTSALSSYTSLITCIEPSNTVTVSFAAPNTSDRALPRNGASTASFTSSDAFFDASSELGSCENEGDDIVHVTVPGKSTDHNSTYNKTLATSDDLAGKTGETERRRACDLLESLYNSGDYTQDAALLWRLARAEYLYSQIFVKTDKQRTKELCFTASTYAQKAADILPDDADVQKWAAICIGSLTDFVGIKEKIQFGHKFKQHVDRALQLRPDCPTLHHIRARWCYGVAELTYWERKAATAFFGTPPKSSYQDALDGFLQAEKYKPNQWIDNLLWTAKAYLAIDVANADKARPYLEKAISLPCNTPDDKVNQEEAQSLLLKYKNPEF